MTALCAADQRRETVPEASPKCCAILRKCPKVQCPLSVHASLVSGKCSGFKNSVENTLGFSVKESSVLASDYYRRFLQSHDGLAENRAVLRPEGAQSPTNISHFQKASSPLGD